VLAALEALKQDYEQPGGGCRWSEVAGGYQITTRPELHDWVRRLFHERTTQKLSVASLETLSVVAYKQPVTAAEIGEIRGVNTSGVLSTLLERHLIKIVGRKNVVGRPFLYGTTKEFLIRFGLKDVNDLPKVEDMAQRSASSRRPCSIEQPVPKTCCRWRKATPPTPRKNGGAPSPARADGAKRRLRPHGAGACTTRLPRPRGGRLPS
jgi:segregation and condensation protein B